MEIHYGMESGTLKDISDMIKQNELEVGNNMLLVLEVLFHLNALKC